MYSLDGIGDASIGMDGPFLALNDSLRREQQIGLSHSALGQNLACLVDGERLQMVNIYLLE